MDCCNNKDKYHHKIPKSLFYLPIETANCIIMHTGAQNATD